MPKTNHTLSLNINSAKIKQMINDSKFTKQLNRLNKVSIDTSYDIPYISCCSLDGKTLYLDRHLTPYIDKVDITGLILIGEYAESLLRNMFKITYKEAHHIALYIEREYANTHNINWNKYLKFIKTNCKRISNNRIRKIPSDMDIESYKDEKDFKLLNRMLLNAR